MVLTAVFRGGVGGQAPTIFEGASAAHSIRVPVEAGGATERPGKEEDDSHEELDKALRRCSSGRSFGHAES